MSFISLNNSIRGIYIIMSFELRHREKVMKNLSSLILSYPLLNHDLTDCDCCCWQALLIVTLTSKDLAPIGLKKRMFTVLALSGERGLVRLLAAARGLLVTTLPGQVKTSF